MCAKSQELAAEAGVPEDILQWMHANDMRTYVDIAMMCSEEKEVKEEIVGVLRASLTDHAWLKRPIATINLKKLWIACRDCYNSAKAPKPSPLQTI